MRKVLPLSPALLLLTLLTAFSDLNTSAQSIVASLSRNGELSCTNLEPGTIATVEWAASANGPWYTNWTAQQSLTADSQGAFTVSVPMFYRVRGVPRSTAYYIAINELQTAGSAGAADEFVELHNPGANPVDLKGSRLVYRSAMGSTDTTLITFTNSVLVAPSGYLLLTGPAYSGSSPSDAAWGSGTLAATGGSVALKNPANEPVDSVGWGTANNLYVEGSPTSVPASGQSIGRIPDGRDTGNNANDFQLRSTPTPRGSNQ